ncbi:MAG: chemotaxis protein MotB [Bdellovibrionales bacterium]|nr:chemotaxis protein MotB [Bdellovibrionales bacterium]
MAKNAKQTIIIKKYNIIAGHHGGAWKVAFADFMTAMMAFFLVMWLMSQSEDVKKQIASYFTGPSMLEHDFSSYGAKLTLEKLFLDLANEPLGTLQKMLQPVDYTPNIMSMGNQEIILHQIAEDIGLLAKSVSINEDQVDFEIYDYMLFQIGGAQISSQFADVMEKIRKLTVGLEDAIVTIDSEIYVETVPGKNIETADRVALQRSYILKKYLETVIKHPSVTIKVEKNVKKAEVLPPSGMPAGSIIFSIKQKSRLTDGGAPRKIETELGAGKVRQSVYEDIVKKVESRKKKQK